jgi:hypothetical protein
MKYYDVKMNREIFPPKIRGPEHEVDHTPSFSTED